MSESKMKRPFPWLTLLVIVALGIQGIVEERRADGWKKLAYEATASLQQCVAGR